MWRKLQEYHRPDTLDAALALLRRTDVPTAPLAGGTDLLARGAPGIAAVVDLQALGLDYIKDDDGDLRIGAMTTLQRLLTEPATQAIASGLLAKATRLSAKRNIRNMATVGGTVAAADPLNELYLAMLALDVQAILDAETPIAIAELTPDRLRGHLITELRLPRPEEPHGAALHRVARTPSDRAIVLAIALVRIRSGQAHCRVVIGGLAPQAVLRDVTANTPTAAREALQLDRIPELLDTPTGSAEYRLAMAHVLAERALREAWQ